MEPVTLRGVLSAEDFRTPEPPATATYTREDFERFAALYTAYELNPRGTNARVELQYEMRHAWRLSAHRMHRAFLSLEILTLTADTLRARAALRGDTVAVAAVRLLRLEFHPDGAAFVLSEQAWSRVAASLGMTDDAFRPLRPMFEPQHVDALVALVREGADER